MPNPNSNSLDYFETSGEPPQQLSGASALTAGATPVLRGLGAPISGAGAVTPLAPAGLTTNDVEFLWVESSDELVTLSTANGFTQVAGSPISVPNATTTIRTRGTLFWRRYAGQGDPTVADAGDHVIARRIAVSGCVLTGDPWDFVQVSSEAVEDTSGSATGGTTLDANRFVVILGGAAKPDANSTAEFNAIVNASLTSLTERADNARNPGNGGFIFAVTGERAVAGTVSATTYTKVNAGYKWHFVVALKPGDEGTSVSRSDSIAVTESRLLSVRIQTNKTESITVTESIGRLITSFAGVSDSIAVTESASAQIANVLAIVISEGVTVTESPIVNIPVDGTVTIVVNELVSVSEAHTEIISTAAVNTSESVTVSETVTIDITRLIAVSEAVTVTESASVIDTVTVSKSESVTVSESRTVTATRARAVTDNITVTESVTVFVGLEINKSETVTVTEANAGSIGMVLTVSDSVTITEFASALLNTSVSISDGVTVSEAVSGLVTSFIIVSDGPTVAESISVTSPFSSEALLISLFDNTTVADAILMSFNPAAASVKNIYLTRMRIIYTTQDIPEYDTYENTEVER